MIAARQWGDVLIAAVVCTVGAGGLVLLPGDEGAHRSPDTFAGVLIASASASLLVRRRWPITVLAVTFALVVVYQLLDYPPEPVLPPVLVALYTVASTGERRRSLIVGAVTCGLVAVTLAVVEPGAYGPELLGALGWVVVGLALGEAVRYHRAYRAEAEDRAARAEASREAEARRRLAEERMRIARDVHDVLAHSIAAINVQAGIGAHLIEGNPQPDAATLAAIAGILRSIAETSRGGVTDLRATLDVLRDDDAAVGDPVPGLGGVSALVGALRSTGTDVAVEVIGDQRRLPPGHDVAAFRIVQEALTNAVKHGRPGRIDVTVAYEPAAVRIVVSDDGAGPPAGSQGGYGILGMTERAGAVGGRLTAGPRRERGFQVEALLPLPFAADTSDPGGAPGAGDAR